MKRDLIYTTLLVLILLFASRVALAGEVTEWKPPPPDEEKIIGRQVNGYMIAGYIFGGLAAVSLIGGGVAIAKSSDSKNECKKRPHDDSDVHFGNLCGIDSAIASFIGATGMTVGALSSLGATIFLTIGYEDYEKSGTKTRIPATGGPDISSLTNGIDSVVLGMKGTFKKCRGGFQTRPYASRHQAAAYGSVSRPARSPLMIAASKPL